MWSPLCSTPTFVLTRAAAMLTAACTCPDLKDPPRLAAAEVLVGRLVVCWEMITGAAAAGVLPHGCVPLALLDVAANLTPGVTLMLLTSADYGRQTLEGCSS